jgi:dTDP-4-dehydrorhamnose reductase
MQTILISGSNGFLAQHLCNFLNKNLKNCTIYGIIRDINKNSYLTNNQCFNANLKDKLAIERIIHQLQPNIIIHAAAMSKPDDCFVNTTACLENNVMATSFLVDAAKKINAKLIYISSDFIYGDDGPHSEKSIPAPLNFYGESKWMAEKIVSISGLKNSIIRPVFVYGPSFGNMKPTFLHWVKRNLENNLTIKVVNDQFRTPTFVYDICYAISTIIVNNVEGDFGIAGEEILTPYELAVKTANYLQLNASLIIPVEANTFKEVVVRAKKGCLINTKAMQMLNFKPTNTTEGIRKTFE